MESSERQEQVGEHRPDAAGTVPAPTLAAEDTDREGAVAETADTARDAPVGDEPQGLLAGTGSEAQPGVGGSGDHPAPAAVLDEAGRLHVAGEPPAGTIAPGQAPAGDATDEQSGEDVTDPEARERLNAVTEPEPFETERPDIGTE